MSLRFHLLLMTIACSVFVMSVFSIKFSFVKVPYYVAFPMNSILKLFHFQASSITSFRQPILYVFSFFPFFLWLLFQSIIARFHLWTNRYIIYFSMLPSYLLFLFIVRSFSVNFSLLINYNFNI